MEDKFYVHIISHSHWDREWYLPMEKHRVKLVQLMDTLMDLFESDGAFKSFHLDGQTIILEDYLDVRPEMRERLQTYIQDGRLQIGPWYILQDAFLTSGEANVRNLMTGMMQAGKWGGIAKVGYFPDTFGNIGQAPQLLKQAGIEDAVFGRGVKPTGFNNMVSNEVNYESPYSEMLWQAPDGSEVLGILFANWYCNANEIPLEEQAAKAYWEKTIDNAKKYAATPHLLLMNGCDHQPVQTNLPEAIAMAKRLFPKFEFIHSNFNDYIKQVKEKMPASLQTIKGELRSQKTDGWGTLVNTASSRVYLKQRNQEVQTMLEQVAEPLATVAATTGKPYPHHLFNHSWKTLMQNHPHDSICGCSVDEVHREMMVRFDKSCQVAENIAADSLEAIAEHIDAAVFYSYEEPVPFAIFNTSGWERSGVVTLELDLARQPFSDGLSKDRLKAIDLSEKKLIAADGSMLAYKMEDLGIGFGYDLPNNRFRQPYISRRVKITFKADKVPALGYKTFALIKSGDIDEPCPASLVKSPVHIENDHLAVSFHGDGSYDVTDKAAGKTYRYLGVYENTGDIGNEYMYKQPEKDKNLTTQGLDAEINVIEDQPFRTTVKITHEWEIPAEADDRLKAEQAELVWFTNRKAERSMETVKLKLTTYVSLLDGKRTLQIKTIIDNSAKDHRLRLLFPTDLRTNKHAADSVFEVAERANNPAPEWQNPSHCHHQQAFVNVADETAGLTVANLGLNEYEILRDGRNTIAVTLLRSVGEMGDWGVFPAPEAQCLGKQKAELQLIFHSDEKDKWASFHKAYQFQVPWTSRQLSLKKEGSLPPKEGFLSWSADHTALTAVKVAEETGDTIIRFFNMSQDPDTLQITPHFQYKTAYKSNILEDSGAEVNGDDGNIEMTLKPYEIVTIGIKK
ncbi:alpha-mannosidase [Scopulibacillus darangshiensis]|uniref:Alpha-mannosidase n=1 Tax=Scopulibacillus darangshiensis TaxID=442528 RepID=A0A4R2NX42_9BACL|nr:alpha-mannosidase [Scopulibacillus darangshiensis]TCP25985.1 alpha-mannosidase [Scopulibacillus darangshiensis]